MTTKALITKPCLSCRKNAFILFFIMIHSLTQINQSVAQQFNQKGLVVDTDMMTFTLKSKFKMEGRRLLPNLFSLPVEFRQHYHAKDTSLIFHNSIYLQLGDHLIPPDTNDVRDVGPNAFDFRNIAVDNLYFAPFKVTFPIGFNNITCPNVSFFNDQITFHDSFLSYVTFTDVRANIYIHSNKLNGDMTFLGDTRYIRLERNLNVGHHKIVIQSTAAKVLIDQNEVNIESTGNNYKDFNVHIKARSGGVLNFKKDIFNESLGFTGMSDTLSKIDEPINLKFEQCHFGKKTNLIVESISKISFIWCSFDSILRIERFNRSKETMELELYRTNVDSLNFEVWGQTKLTFPDYASSQEITAMYLSLLSKFDREHKVPSYQFVDIQYKNYQWNRYLYIGPTLSFIDKWWWDYGYHKGWILMWGFLFLSIFYTINLILSQQLLESYPVLNIRQQNRSKANHLVVMFVLTLYIFFSLRVDLSKLKTTNTSILIYFFIQYFTGLVCLLFLFGAILKF